MDDDDDPLDFLTNFRLPPRDPEDPTFVELTLSFPYALGRAKLAHARQHSLCMLFEPGCFQGDLEAGLKAPLEALGFSWPQGDPWRPLFMHGARRLWRVDVAACDQDKPPRYRDHGKASAAIYPKLNAAVAALAQAARVEASALVDPQRHPRVNLDALEQTFEELMPIHRALRLKKTMEQETPQAAPASKPRL